MEPYRHTPDRSPPNWPYRGMPCRTCGKRKDGGFKCWPCGVRNCAGCGQTHDMMFFRYCWRCELEIEAREKPNVRDRTTDEVVLRIA